MIDPAELSQCKHCGHWFRKKTPHLPNLCSRCIERLGLNSEVKDHAVK